MWANVETWIEAKALAFVLVGGCLIAPIAFIGYFFDWLAPGRTEEEKQREWDRMSDDERAAFLSRNAF